MVLKINAPFIAHGEHCYTIGL